MDQDRTYTATVAGPVAGGKGWPFGSPTYDVAALGCAMEEFFIDGVACSYRPVAGSEVARDGRWRTEIAATAAYRTRMYVVRPTDPARFNGVVLVNWQNVTAGVDLGMPSVNDLGRGFAWVGVTTQRIAVDGQPAIGGMLAASKGLREWDPERYGSLRHPGDEFSYDIFTQAARTVAPGREVSNPDPLGGLEPRRIIALGASQSALRLGSYVNLAHAAERVFAGFLPTVHFGICPYPPNQTLQASFAPVGDGWYAGSSRIRDDSGTPILVVASESETMHNYPVRQPDSQTFRFWEMAGTAHASAAPEMEAVFARDGLASILNAETRNEISWEYVRDAALAGLVEWIETGRAPRSFPPIDVDPGPPAAIRRDRFANALGGIRLPEMEAPTARNSGTNALNPLAALAGESVPFDPLQLAELYADHETFLEAWDTAVDSLAADELVLPDAVDAVRARGRELAERRVAQLSRKAD